MSAPTPVAPLRVLAEPSDRPRAVGPPRRQVRFGLLGHAPALDGLRGLAVAMVVVYHFVGHDFLRGGWAGVDVFFALSGFLITALILDERRVHGRIDLKRFYARRACRLLPALLFMLAIWTVLLLLWHDSNWIAATPSGDGTGRPVDVSTALGDVGMAIGYVANWNVIIGGSEAPIPHLWSLAVEEQFYILWPSVLLLLLTLARRTRLVVTGALVAVSAALPWLYYDGGAGKDRIYFGTDTRAVGLLAGAFCALVWHHRKALGRTTRYAAARAWAGLAVVLVIAYVGNVPGKFLVVPALLGLLLAQVVPYLADGRGGLSRALSTPVLIWLGKRSYALYLWHYLWATWMHPLGTWPGFPLGVLGSLVCTQISWTLVEAPVLRYAQRFKISQAPSPLTGTVPRRQAA